VIFRSRLRQPAADYAETSERMLTLARQQPGFLDYVSVRDEDGQGLTITFWKDAGSVQAWRDHLEHAAARRRGRRDWYLDYDLCVATVHRSSDWRAPGPANRP
jgi:heme-degrading monooxygenase HmoA